MLEQQDRTLAGKESPRRSSSLTSPATDQSIYQCGNWLLGIPRDDVSVLANTDEYHAFIEAFRALERSYRRVISYSAPSPSSPLSYPTDPILSSSTSQPSIVSAESPRRNTTTSSSEYPSPETLENTCYSRSPVQINVASGGCCEEMEKFTDDVLLKILEFLESTSLIQTSKACSRFRMLSDQSATQRTARLARERQLSNAMQLLRVQEQLNGVNWWGESDIGGSDCSSNHGIVNFLPVRVPILLLGRAVVVTGAGDPEYNGHYICSDCNSNGFVFTKPRFPFQQLSKETRTTITDRDEQHNETLARPETGLQQVHQHVRVDPPGDPPGAVVENGIHLAPAQLQALINAQRHANHGHDNQDADDRTNQQHHHEDETHLSQNHSGRPTHLINTHLLEDESKRPLRCIIYKKWSRQHIFWYMAKEEAGNETHEVTYSYWAPLAVGAPLDIHNYPSTSSYLSFRSQQWRPLSTVSGASAVPPTVELLN